MITIDITVNGVRYTREAEERTLLVNFLRDTLGLTGTHIGCDTSQCGCCTVHVDGRAVKSCSMLAVQANGAEVLTIEGMARHGKLHPIQQAFTECHGLQCGYCTPGMIMEAAALLNGRKPPTEARVRLFMEGHLCRCGMYNEIVQAVLDAAKEVKRG